MNVELVAQMFKNYRSNVLFHLEGKASSNYVILCYRRRLITWETFINMGDIYSQQRTVFKILREWPGQGGPALFVHVSSACSLMKGYAMMDDDVAIDDVD